MTAADPSLPESAPLLPDPARAFPSPDREAGCASLLAGRQRETAELMAALGGFGPRVVLITGDPGIGKTSLLRHLIVLATSRNRPVAVFDDPSEASRPQAKAALGDPRQDAVLAFACRTGRVPSWLPALGAPITQITLGPLGPDAIAALLPALPESRRNAIHRISGGNPRYAVALSIMDGQAIDGLEAGLGGNLRGDLRSLLPSELTRMGPAQRRIAQCLALAGSEARLDLVVAIAERPDAEVSEALDELVNLGVAEAAGGSFSFRHPLVRAAVYHCSGPGWRVRAHQRASAYLDRCGGPLPLRAEHCARAAAYGDLAAVSTLSAAAAAHLDAAPAQAAAWLSAALSVLPEDPRHHQMRSELTLLLARAHALAGALETSLHLIQQLLTDRRDGPHRGVAVRYCVVVQRLLGRFEQAEAMLESELADQPRAGRLLTELSVVRLFRNDTAGAIQAAETALSEATKSGDRPELAIATTVAALAAAQHGDPATATRHLAAAGPMVDALSDTVLREHPHLFPALAWSQHILGRSADAVRQLGRGLDIAERTGQRVTIPYLLTVRAALRIRQGSLTAALADAAGAAEAGRAIGSRETTAMARAVELRAVLWKQGPDAAALLLSDPPRSQRWAEIFDESVAAIELAARRPQACVDHLTSRIGDASVVTRPLLWASLAIARSRLGASAAALDDAHRALHDARESGLAFGVGVARAAYAQVLLAAGERPDIAVSEAQESVRCLLAAEAPVDAALAQVVLAECLAEAGDLASARTQLGQAKAAFAAAGAHWLASNATRAEARLGARAARPHRGGALGLTALSERELEIAQLAASGLTNREIAARLYLSAKTVEAHLGRIFGKLGVRSRVDVASLISAQPS